MGHMTELFPITIEDQIACVNREISMRKNAYPRFVANKQMTQEKADRELAVMSEVLTTLTLVKTWRDGSRG
jgi:hypothetical protein